MRQALQALWESRSGGLAAWTLWRHGFCQGCGLGHSGPHLCEPGLRHIQRVTAPALVPADLLDIRRLRRLGGARGRLGHPYRYRVGDRGFTRISWSEALAELRGEFSVIGSSRCVETRAAMARAPVVSRSRPGLRAMEQALGVAGSTCDLSDLSRADLVLLWRCGSEHHPLLARWVRRARSAGAPVVVVGEEPDLPSLLDEWLRIGPEDDLGLSDALIAQLDPNLARLASFTTQFEHIARRNNERSEALSSRLQWLAGRIRTSERLVTVSSEGAPEQAVRALVNLHLATEQVSGPGRGILMLPEPARTGLVLQRPGLQAFLHTSLETEMLEGEEDVLLLPMASEHERPGGALVQSAGLRVQYAPQLLLAPGEALAPWEVLGDLTDAGWADVDDLRREEGLGFGWLERPCRDHDYEALPEGLARFA